MLRVLTVLVLLVRECTFSTFSTSTFSTFGTVSTSTFSGFGTLSTFSTTRCGASSQRRNRTIPPAAQPRHHTGRVRRLHGTAGRGVRHGVDLPVPEKQLLGLRLCE